MTGLVSVCHDFWRVEILVWTKLAFSFTITLNKTVLIFTITMLVYYCRYYTYGYFGIAHAGTTINEERGRCCHFIWLLITINVVAVVVT